MSKLLGLLCGYILLMSAGLAVAAAQPTLRLQVVDKESGLPLRQAIVTAEEVCDGSDTYSTSATTTADGRAAIGLSHPESNFLRLTIQKPGFGTCLRSFSTDYDPDFLSEETKIEVPPAVLIRGRVVDETSHPIVGAMVNYAGLGGHVREANALDTTPTDADGWWSMWLPLNAYPNFFLQVHHPEFMHATIATPEITTQSLVSTPYVFRLPKAYLVSGRVLDPQGKPVEGAKIGGDESLRLNYLHFHLAEAVTGKNGEFRICMSQENGTLPTITAKGFAIWTESMPVNRKSKPVEVHLARGSRLQITVLDSDGNPISSAAVYTAKNNRSSVVGVRGQTDNRGIVTWENAEPDKYEWYAEAPGFFRRKIDVRPMAHDASVRLMPLTHLHANVVDAETSRPIPQFRFITGSELPSARMDWPPADVGELCRDGLVDKHLTDWMSSMSDQPTSVAGFIIAPGYMAQQTPVYPPGQKEVDTTFSLIRGIPIHGNVLDADGRPVTSATVCIAGQLSEIEADNGQLKMTGPFPSVETDSTGAFFAAPQPGFYTAAVAHELGYVQTDLQYSTTASLVLRLQPWSSVEIHGGAVNANQKVSGRYLDRMGYYDIRWNVDAEADSSGVARLVHLPAGLWDLTIGNRNCNATLRAGEKQIIELPAGNALVTGKTDLLTTAICYIRENAAQVQLTEILPKARVLNQTNSGSPTNNTIIRYHSVLTGDGSFRFADIPAGDYSLLVTESWQVAREHSRPRQYAFQIIHVPAQGPGKNSNALDVGEMKMTAAVENGDIAPDITGYASDGSPVRLADFRGKWVLVDFWGQYCGPCIKLMKQQLKPLWEKEKSRNQLVILSVTDDAGRTGTEKIIRTNQFDWVHAFIPDNAAPLWEAYGIQGIPHLFLINPKGVIVDKDVDLESPGKVTSLEQRIEKECR